MNQGKQPTQSRRRTVYRILSECCIVLLGCQVADADLCSDLEAAGLQRLLCLAHCYWQVVVVQVSCWRALAGYCGYPMITPGSARPGIIALRAGRSLLLLCHISQLFSSK